MDKPRKYATAMAFRRALEDRLKVIADEGRLELQRLRREISFDRLLARLFAEKEAPWVLKGGYALELRLKVRFSDHADHRFGACRSPSRTKPIAISEHADHRFGQADRPEGPG